MWGAIAGAGIGLNALTSGANVWLQWLNYKYQKSLQNQLFAREDTSIQRRVADLKAAGLSPVLAAGQGAGTGGTVSTTPPQLNNIPTAETALNMLKMKQDISLTEAQQKLIEQQTKESSARTSGHYKVNRLSEINAKNAESSGIGSPNTTVGGYFKDLNNMFRNYAEEERKIKDKKRGKQKSPQFWDFNIR